MAATQIMSANMSGNITPDLEAADLEKFINDLEFENQQYIKEIQREVNRVAENNSSISKLKEKVSSEQEGIQRLESQTKKNHRHFTEKRDTIGSLKDTMTVLTKHEEALQKNCNETIKRKSIDREDWLKKVKDCTNLLEVYKQGYTKLKLAQKLRTEATALRKCKEELKSILIDIDETSSRLLKNTESDTVTYTDVKRFVVKLAEEGIECLALRAAQNDLQEDETIIKRKCKAVQEEISKKKEELKQKLEDQAKKEEEEMLVQANKKKEEMIVQTNKKKEEMLMQANKKKEEMKMQKKTLSGSSSVNNNNDQEDQESVYLQQPYVCDNSDKQEIHGIEVMQEKEKFIDNKEPNTSRDKCLDQKVSNDTIAPLGSAANLGRRFNTKSSTKFSFGPVGIPSFKFSMKKNVVENSMQRPPVNTNITSKDKELSNEGFQFSTHTKINKMNYSNELCEHPSNLKPEKAKAMITETTVKQSMLRQLQESQLKAMVFPENKLANTLSNEKGSPQGSNSVNIPQSPSNQSQDNNMRSDSSHDFEQKEEGNCVTPDKGISSTKQKPSTPNTSDGIKESQGHKSPFDRQKHLARVAQILQSPESPAAGFRFEKRNVLVDNSQNKMSQSTFLSPTLKRKSAKESLSPTSMKLLQSPDVKRLKEYSDKTKAADKETSLMFNCGDNNGFSMFGKDNSPNLVDSGKNNEFSMFGQESSPMSDSGKNNEFSMFGDISGTPESPNTNMTNFFGENSNSFFNTNSMENSEADNNGFNWNFGALGQDNSPQGDVMSLF